MAPHFFLIWKHRTRRFHIVAHHIVPIPDGWKSTLCECSFYVQRRVATGITYRGIFQEDIYRRVARHKLPMFCPHCIEQYFEHKRKRSLAVPNAVIININPDDRACWNMTINPATKLDRLKFYTKMSFAPDIYRALNGDIWRALRNMYMRDRHYGYVPTLYDLRDAEISRIPKGYWIGELTKKRLICARWLAGIPGPAADLRLIPDYARNGPQKAATKAIEGSYKTTHSKIDPDLEYPPMYVFGYYDNGHLDVNLDEHTDSFDEAAKQLVPKDVSDMSGTPVIFEIKIAAEAQLAITFVRTNVETS